MIYEKKKPFSPCFNGEGCLGVVCRRSGLFCRISFWRGAGGGEGGGGEGGLFRESFLVGGGGGVFKESCFGGGCLEKVVLGGGGCLKKVVLGVGGGKRRDV